MSVFPLPCIICGVVLEAMHPRNSESNQTHSGLSFSSTGSYGSVFDPMSGNVKLVVTLCDKCLAEKREQQLVAFERNQTYTVVETVKLWEADDE